MGPTKVLQESLPAPSKYVKQLPFMLYLRVVNPKIDIIYIPGSLA